MLVNILQSAQMKLKLLQLNLNTITNNYTVTTMIFHINFNDVYITFYILLCLVITEKQL